MSNSTGRGLRYCQRSISSKRGRLSEHGKELLRRGTRVNNQVLTILQIEGPTREAQAKLRANMRILRSAMNHLEDTPGFEPAHHQLDAAGQLARTRMPTGCHFEM